MQIQIFSNSVTLGDNQKAYINDKVKNLQKYEDRVSDEATIVRVDVEKRKMRTGDQKIVTQITMYLPNSVVRAERDGSTVEETIDLAIEKLKKQIERYKTKKHRRDKGGNWIEESTLEAVSESGTPDVDFEAIVKRKKYSDLTPMKENEAIEQMELLDHDFYAFINDDTGLFSVVYRRQDGDCGLIELEKKQY